MKKQEKTNNSTKSKIVALIVASLAAIGLTYGNNTKTEQEPVKKVENHQPSKPSIEEMRAYIAQADKALANLKTIIESDETNPQERFDARNAYRSITKKRAEIQKTLDEATKKTVYFDNVKTSR